MALAVIVGIAALIIVNPGMSQERFIQEEIKSRALGTSRTVRIYLPASYANKTQRRYPVLYLHDGQNAFSTAGAHCCFGWGSWAIDQTAGELAASGRMKEVILVAIDNSRFRYQEYRGPAYPYSAEELAALKNKPSGANDDSRFEAYTSFLIEELKPKIDRDYRTQPGPRDTGLIGSSMGGIASLVIAWEHPEVFGLAASLSGAFQVERTNFIRRVLVPYSGRPKPLRLYLDSGTVDFSGGDDGRKHTERVAAELRRIGWKDDLLHYVDEKPLSEADLEKTNLSREKWAEAKTSQHNEFYWRLRTWRALTFLFPVGK